MAIFRQNHIDIVLKFNKMLSYRR